MDKKQMGIMIKFYRGSLSQIQLGQMVWPGDDENLARNRIAKYEKGLAMPPADVYLRIKDVYEILKGAA